MKILKLESLNNIETLASNLGIEFLSLDKDKLVARMPVDKRTKQPFGILHGGASAALVETLASIGSLLNIDSSSEIALGVELHCRHLNSLENGWVVGTASPKKLGKNIHFWDVEVVKEEDSSHVICKGSCTLFVRKNKKIANYLQIDSQDGINCKS